uniref:Uncharacterized protein n=1 Tax=Zea mays TaxID=4577 RepID=B6TD51_MAIZE|nr:hypothetical protein [Zea mays]
MNSEQEEAKEGDRTGSREREKGGVSNRWEGHDLSLWDHPCRAARS